MRHNTRKILWPALIVAAVTAGGLAVAQGYGTSGSPTTSAELQRGVPGVDVDLGTNGRAQTNGVPGLDIDLQASGREAAGTSGQDVDTRALGAGADSGATGTMRPPIQDRN